MNTQNLEIIDNKISNILITSDNIVNELNEQNDKLNNISNKIIQYEEILNISKYLYKTTTSWLYSLDYFNIYQKYQNYNKIKIEELELDNFNDDIIIYDKEDNNLLGSPHCVERNNNLLGSPHCVERNNNLLGSPHCVERNIINKLKIVKDKAIYIGNILDKQNNILDEHKNAIIELEYKQRRILD
jgi:hypothetical protein